MDKKETTKKDLRQFGIVSGLILCVFGGMHFMKKHENVYPWFFGVAFMSVFLGAFLPRVLKPVYLVFRKVAHAIGWFNTRVILAVVYYILLTPIGIIMRLFGKDFLNRKLDKDTESYWIKREKGTFARESLENQF